MPYYLAPYVGSGTRADPFLPRGAAGQPGWSAIDLRPDASQQDGFCFLYLPVADADPQLRLLADDRLEVITAGTRDFLRNRLSSPDLTADRLDRVVGILMRQPPADRWKALQPNRRTGRFEVWLGGLLYEEPFIAGGASDNFNRANETPLAAPWAKAVSGQQNLDLSSNAVLAAVGGNNWWYYDGAVGGNDQYAQFKITTLGSGDCGPAVRMNRSSALSNLYIIIHSASPQIAKFVSDTYTPLVFVTSTPANGDVFRIEVEGSTLRYIENGVEAPESPITDTSLTTGDVGMFVVDAGTIVVDDWEGGDLLDVRTLRPAMVI